MKYSGAIICRVAMIDGDQPYLLPFNYGYSDVEILSDDQSKQHGLEVIMAGHRAPELNEFSVKNLGRMVILKHTITSMTGKQSSNWPGV